MIPCEGRGRTPTQIGHALPCSGRLRLSPAAEHQPCSFPGESTAALPCPARTPLLLRGFYFFTLLLSVVFFLLVKSIFGEPAVSCF